MYGYASRRRSGEEGGMITLERLLELETMHRNESMPLRAEMRELTDAYIKLAAAERDAARYRYMRDDGYGVTIDVLEYDDDGGEDWVSGHSPADLDEAIDRFMQPDNGGSGSQL